MYLAHICTESKSETAENTIVSFRNTTKNRRKALLAGGYFFRKHPKEHLLLLVLKLGENVVGRLSA